MGFPGGSVVKYPPANTAEAGSIPGSGRSPGVGNGNPLQCSCLENPQDMGVWWAAVHGVTKSQTHPSILSPNELKLGSSSSIIIFLAPFPPNFYRALRIVPRKSENTHFILGCLGRSLQHETS